MDDTGSTDHTESEGSIASCSSNLPVVSPSDVVEDESSSVILRSSRSKAAGWTWKRRLRSRGFWNVATMGFGFMLEFFAFNTVQGYLTTVLKSSGNLSLTILYAVFSVSNILSPPVVRFFGARACIFAGCLAYNFFIFCHIFGAEWLQYTCSAILGAGAALMWTGQGTFLAANSRPGELGFNTGLFFCIFFIHAVPGNLMASILFSTGQSARVVFVSLLCVGCVGNAILLLLRPAQPSPWVGQRLVRLIKRISVRNRHNNLIDGTVEGDSLSERKSTISSIASRCVEIFVVLFDPRMLALACIIMYSGVSQSFLYGSLPPHMGETLTGYAMAVFGLSDVAGSLFLGPLSDKIGRKPVILFFFAGGCMAVFCSFVSLMHGGAWYFLAYLGFGISDSGVNTQTYATLGILFPTKSQAAFANFKLIQTLTQSAAFFYAVHISANVQLIIVLACLTFGAGFFLLLAAEVDISSRSSPQEAATREQES